ncbi:MAG: hypothetical protein K2M82_02420 [Lachnospiraceae bacterium]|nr:hypothetical protein [Lachnospiraceae bacterium]
MKNKDFIKRVVASAIAAPVLLSFIINAYAANIDEGDVGAVEERPTLQAVVYEQPTQLYEDYLNGDVEVDENSGVGISPYEVSGSTLAPGFDLPSSHRSVCTPVRDQGSYQTCWAFSAMASLESFLLKNGKGERDLSEQHLSWWATSDYNRDGTGWQMNGLTVGGYNMISTGYLMSWQGAKNENDLPYYVGGNNLPDNMDSVGNSYNVTGIVYVGEDIQSVKTAVYKYGAVATSYNSANYYNYGRTAYYQPGPTSRMSGHAVAIVGWDDNYSKENFSSVARPSSDGAWLVKNSWGDDVCDNGYLWISYEDFYILDTSIWGMNYSITSARTANPYDKLYQNETYGATYSLQILDTSADRYCESATFINVFNFDDAHNILEKVIFETKNENSRYTVSYIPVVDDKPTTNTALWTLLASGTADEVGYISVDIPNFSVPAGVGAIGVTIDAADSNTGFAIVGVDEWLTNADNEYLFVPDTKRNQSYICYNDSMYDIVDVYANQDDSIGGNLVIKALTTTNRLGDVNLDGNISILDAYAVMRSCIGLISLSDYTSINADVDLNGSINLKDAYYIQRRSINLISDF